MDEPPPSPAPSQAAATPRPRVLDEVLPPEERSALATSIRILRPPGTSRKERVQQLDQLAASGERAGAAGLAQLFAEHDGLWETLLEQCLHKEPLVRVYAHNLYI